MNRTILLGLLLLSPLVLLIFVNETHSTPSENYDPARCTRYCHSQGCLHIIRKYEHNPSSFIKKCFSVYQSSIHWLGHSGSGLRYRDMNLLLFVACMPFAMALMLWGAIRK